MSVGDICFLNYGEHPVTWHVRLLGCHIHQNWWSIVTPDGDIYEEEMSLANPDLTDFEYGGPGLGSPIPARISAAQVYGFPAITAVEYQQYLMQARVYAAGARAALGVAAPAAPAAGPPGGGVAAAGVAPMAGVVDDPEVWVAIEDRVGVVPGQVMVAAHQPLPPGHMVLGDRAVIPHGGSQLCVKKIKTSELGTMGSRDLRLLPLKFDSQGRRHRDFADCVALMSQDNMPGGGCSWKDPPLPSMC